MGVLKVRWNDRGKPVMIAVLRALLLGIHEKEEARFSSPQNVEDAQIADGSHVSTRGTKRVADEQLEPEPESLDVGESRNYLLKTDGGHVGQCWCLCYR